ncbi:hypothetical protein L5515_010725 [Caenorhabditis briggsae]|uniref:PAN-3 domain-containing protein n=1 Tax=Caenorhabditis briggsae TaxID=6238 RepID=A0AAE9ES56_CAEBR|nr:hypothetical protein L5515_010725 [Caenorhabditis briggsae]
MMVVFGTPTVNQNANTFLNTDWNTCLQLCYQSVPCLLAWQSGSNCLTFNYTATGPVTQLQSISVVAFKVDNPSSQCPNGTNPPTFNNKNATGSLSITDSTEDKTVTRISYETYLEGGIWHFGYTYAKSCPDGFNSNLRADGSIKCFRQWLPSDGGVFDHDRAVAICTEDFASLAGITTQEDLTFVTNIVQALRYNVSSPNVYARIVGIRTNSCQGSPKSATCQSVKGFEFTDTTVQNFTYYNWLTNSSAQASTSDNCIVMVANGTNPITTDVRSCDADTPLPASIVICSRPAWV